MSRLTDAVRVRLIDDLGRAHRFLSVRLMMLTGALFEAWAEMPESLRDHVPPEVAARIAIGLLVLCAIARVIKQPVAEPPPQDPPHP